MDEGLGMDSQLKEFTNSLSIKSSKIVDVMCLNNLQQHILLTKEESYV
jgi:hypothetical protein|tara:strand:- start:1374 stop:1517 length:144 start_codon:yes stop_codon:yes gene_type:complete